MYLPRLPLAVTAINSMKRRRFDLPVPFGPMRILRSPGSHVTFLSERKPSILSCLILIFVSSIVTWCRSHLKLRAVCAWHCITRIFSRHELNARLDNRSRRARIGFHVSRRCGRVAEGGGLLNRYRSKAYRRFESCHLRHQDRPPSRLLGFQSSGNLNLFSRPEAPPSVACLRAVRRRSRCSFKTCFRGEAHHVRTPLGRNPLAHARVAGAAAPGESPAAHRRLRRARLSAARLRQARACAPEPPRPPRPVVAVDLRA